MNVQKSISSSTDDVNDNDNLTYNRQDKLVFTSTWHELLFVLVVCSCQFMALVGAVQGIPQMAAIATTFNIKEDHIIDLGWCNAAYATTLGAFTIIAGKLGDIYGHKFIFCSGYGWLTLWSLLTGFSRYSTSNAIFFYFCRGCQGIGSAFLFPTSITLLGNIYPPCKRKHYVFSFFGACAPWGIVCGLGFSALFTQLSHWSWTYWSMGIISLMITLLAIIVIPNKDYVVLEKNDVCSCISSFDFFGGFCGISGLILFSIVWNQAPRLGFATIYIYVLLIISVVLLVMAFLIDSRVKDPLIPWTQICSKSIKVSCCVFFGYLAFTIWLFYTWRYMIVVKNNSLLLAAAKFSPLAVTSFFASILSAILLNTRVPVQIRMLFALCCSLISSLLMATTAANQIYWGEMFVAHIFIAIALDTIFPSATLIFSNGVPTHLKGVSASLVGTLLNYATALGPGVATTIVRYECFACLSKTGNQFIRSVQIAGYLAIGCSGIGVIIAVIGTIDELFTRDRGNQR